MAPLLDIQTAPAEAGAAQLVLLCLSASWTRMNEETMVACTDTATLKTYRQALAAWLTFPSPWLLLAFAGVSAYWRSRLGSLDWMDAFAVILGLGLWPWVEWALHRYVLHMKPLHMGKRCIDLAWSRKHRAHHQSPTQPQLILLPPALHFVAGGLLLFAAQLSPAPEFTFSLVCGVALAALNYEWTHFLVHTRVRPKLAYYQKLFRSHRLHHFRNENYWFGFSLTQVDRFLGTGPEAESVERSAHCFDLGITPESAQAAE